MNWLIYSNAVLFGGFVFSMILRAIVTWKILRKETHAFLIDRDLNTVKVKKIDLRKRTFKYDEGAYNITKPYMKNGTKSYLIYVVGNADPVDIRLGPESMIPADVYKETLEAEFIKNLNRGDLFKNLNWKTIGIIAGVLIFGYLIISSGAFS